MKFNTLLITLLALGLVHSKTIDAQETNPLSICAIQTTNDQDSLHFGIMLPPSYENNSHAFPVIYYMHGMNRYYAGSRAQWIASFFYKQMEEEQLPGFIMVFIDGGEGLWMDHCDGDPLLETEIVKYLIPHMDDTYRTDPSKRLTMGWSAGGNGAMFFFTRHPELFAGGISLDGGIITYEDFLSRLGERLDAVCDSDYYYEYGSPFGWVKKNREILLQKQDTAIFLSAALLKEANKAFLSELQSEGIPAKYIEVNCSHEFGCVFSESQDDLIAFMVKIMERD